MQEHSIPIQWQWDSVPISSRNLSQKPLWGEPGCFWSAAFHLGDIQKGLDGITAKIQNSLEQDHIPALDKAISDLVAKVTPKKTNEFAVPPGGTSDAATKTFTVSSPLLDQGTADMLDELLADVKKAANDKSPPMSWASLTRCRCWDEVETEYPSVVFLEWYQTL